jgi:hypothetical protein
LGDPALKRLIKAEDYAKCYRIEGEEPPQLHTLSDIKKIIKRRLDQEPRLKLVEIVLYTDSPARQVPRVDDLRRWLDDLRASRKADKLKVEFREPDEKAPAR